VSAAAEHVRELHSLLDTSQEQQQQFDSMVGQLASHAAHDLRLSRFWLAYEVSQSTSERHEHIWFPPLLNFAD
jgi:hypothetical protein